MIQRLLYCTIPVLLSGFFVLSFVVSCSSPKNNPVANVETATSTAFDSLQKTHIDSLVSTINAGLPEVGLPQKLAFPVYQTNDSINYWFLKNDAARISIEWKLPNEVKWPTFFVY